MTDDKWVKEKGKKYTTCMKCNFPVEYVSWFLDSIMEDICFSNYLQPFAAFWFMIVFSTSIECLMSTWRLVSQEHSITFKILPCYFFIVLIYYGLNTWNNCTWMQKQKSRKNVIICCSMHFTKLWPQFCMWRLISRLENPLLLKRIIANELKNGTHALVL